MKKIILAIDTFKGSLSSTEAATAAMKGIKKVWPEAQIKKIAVADGGEGLLNSLIQATNGKFINLYAHDPIMRKIPTRYGILGDQKTAVIEVAEVNGLTLLSPFERHPLLTTSYGTGELIRDALEKGFRQFIIGLGGSAICDGGLGMLEALGIKFYDKSGKCLHGNGENMIRISKICCDELIPAFREANITVACDVDNPFYGPSGAAYIFAPQKGATPAEVELLDKGLKNLNTIFQQTIGSDVSAIPGSGAAGGLGGCITAFSHNCKLKAGIDLLLETIGFADLIKDADLLITGEGKSDIQTLHGKVPMGILRYGIKYKIPTILIAGAIDPAVVSDLNKTGFRAVFSITPGPINLENAMNKKAAEQNMQNTMTQICRLIESVKNP